MSKFADYFLVNTRPGKPLNADAAAAPPDEPKSKVTDFVTQQSFASFTVSTAVTKALWKGFQKVFSGWADSAWLPLGLCGLFGAGQFLLALRNKESKLETWDHILFALVVAVTNTLILWFATLGIEPAADDIGITGE